MWVPWPLLWSCSLDFLYVLDRYNGKLLFSCNSCHEKMCKKHYPFNYNQYCINCVDAMQCHICHQIIFIHNSQISAYKCHTCDQYTCHACSQRCESSKHGLNCGHRFCGLCISNDGKKWCSDCTSEMRYCDACHVFYSVLECMYNVLECM